SEGCRDVVELLQRMQGAGQQIFAAPADRAVAGRIQLQLLTHEAETAVPYAGAGVRCEVAAERFEEGGLASAVLAEHGESVARGEGEVHLPQKHPVAAREAEAADAKMRGGGGVGSGGGGVRGVVRGHVVPSGEGSPGMAERRPVGFRTAARGGVPGRRRQRRARGRGAMVAALRQVIDMGPTLGRDGRVVTRISVPSPELRKGLSASPYDGSMTDS